MDVYWPASCLLALAAAQAPVHALSRLSASQTEQHGHAAVPHCHRDLEFMSVAEAQDGRVMWLQVAQTAQWGHRIQAYVRTPYMQRYKLLPALSAGV